MKNKIAGFLIDSKSVAIFSNDLTHASLAKWINLTSPNSSVQKFAKSQIFENVDLALKSPARNEWFQRVLDS